MEQNLAAAIASAHRSSSSSLHSSSRSDRSSVLHSSSSFRQHIDLDEWRQTFNSVSVPKSMLNSLIMNWLLVEGYQEVAHAFCEESHTQPDIPLSSLSDRMSIRALISSGNMDEALNTLKQLDPLLLKDDPQLEFDVSQQKLIELIRAGDIDIALEYARSIVAPLASNNTDFLLSMESVMSLLAWPDPNESPASYLLGVSQRQTLADKINQAILRRQAKHTESQLGLLIRKTSYAQNELSSVCDFPTLPLTYENSILPSLSTLIAPDSPPPNILNGDGSSSLSHRSMSDASEESVGSSSSHSPALSRRHASSSLGSHGEDDEEEDDDDSEIV